MKKRLSNYLIRIILSIIYFFNLDKNRTFRNLCYSVDFLLSEHINIFKGHRLRDDSLFKFSEKFVKYLLKTPNLNEKIITLKEKVDNLSKRIIDTTIEKYLYIYTHNLLLIDDFNNTSQDLKEYGKVTDYLIKNKNRYVLLPKEFNHYRNYIFYYKHGLIYLSKNEIKKTENKDFIDAGAYIGDSALMFAKEFKPKKIYAFEPSGKNYRLLKQTIRLNKLNNCVPVKKGVGDKNTNTRIVHRESLSYLDENGDEKIEITTIDNYVHKNKLDVGLIKMDIEGNELKAILGAENTIKKFKPVLLICIYHSGVDFFEIKPLIEKWVKGYRFMIRKLDPLHPTYEVMLIGYH